MNKVVVLGGGYGGTSVIHQLIEKDLPPHTEIILIDRMPYQGLKTEYYALAAGTVADQDIRVPFPKHPNVKYRYGDVTSIDLERRLVHMQDGDSLSYDYLAVSLGCTDKYHGVPGADQYTHSLQSLSAARRTFCSIQDLKPYAQVSVVGGGLSGVEIAAELRESRPDLNVQILDRGPSILSPFPARLQEYVRSWFEAHDVKLIPHASIKRVEPGTLWNAEQELPTDLIVWTAGIQPVKVVQDMNVAKDPQGRVIINEYHQIPEYPEVYVIGDCASLPFSPSGQLAEAQGKQVGEVLQAIWSGETPKLDRIKLKGTLGSLGKKAGFGLMGNKTVMIGRVPRVLKSGVLWMSKHHFG